MTRIDAAVRLKLKSSTLISDIIGKRAYPDKLPLNAVLPAISVLKISDIPDKDVPGAYSARVQISCWSNPPVSPEGIRSPEEVENLVDVVEEIFHVPQINMVPTAWPVGKNSYSVSKSQVSGTPRIIEDTSGYLHVPVDVLIEFRK